MLVNVTLLRKLAITFGHSEALVIAELFIQPRTKEELAGLLNRTVRTVSTYLKPLVCAGLIRKNPISHVWELTDSFFNNEIEKNEKNISIKQTNNIHTNESIKKNSKQVETTHMDETFTTKKQHFSDCEKESSLTPEHFKAARLASIIMFGQAIDDSIKEIAKLMKEFVTLDLSIIAKAAHIVRAKVKSNPIMMLVSTYRNIVKAAHYMRLIKRPSEEENGSNQPEPANQTQTYFQKRASQQRSNKYDVFYQYYAQTN